MDLITLLCWVEFLAGAALGVAIWLRARRMPEGWFRIWTQLSVLVFVAVLFFGTLIAEEPLSALVAIVFGPLAAAGGLADDIMVSRAIERDAARRAETKRRRDEMRALLLRDGAPAEEDPSSPSRTTV